MEKQCVRLGYAPTKRDGFDHPEYRMYRDQTLARIKALGGASVEIVELLGINENETLEYASDVEKTVRLFEDARIDGVFFPHCNFGMEAVVAKIAAKLKVPVLLWGPRDHRPESGVGRTRDTQCGLFATGKALRRMNVPFTYLPNCTLEDPAFDAGFLSFVAVCNVVKDFRHTRILQIGVRPEPFWTVICNEGELLERFGIQILPLTLTDLTMYVEKLKQNGSAAVDAAFEDFKARLNCACATDEQMMNMARLRVAIKELCGQYECNAVAIHCWAALHKAVGAATCTINGILTEEGIPVVCETDIHGAISSVILQAAARHTKTTFFADLTIRHPDNENAEMLWHCGNFPPSLAKDPKKRNLTMICQQLGPIPTQSNWEIVGGDITVCRFDGDHGQYQLFIGEGKGVEGPETTGTYCWFEVDNWPKWEKHLVEGPYIHHVSGVHLKVAHVLAESCKYLGVKVDAVSPNEETLEQRWLNGSSTEGV
ncbi:MAG: L-fucose/L-arabinose isomerase family protein [Clostridia bacterium]